MLVALAAVAAGPALAQGTPGVLGQIPHQLTLPPSGPDAIRYLDAPVQRLQESIPALKGLKSDPSQEQLPAILASVAKTIADVLPRLPDLVSKEEIYHFQSKRDPSSAGGLASLQPWSREYKYLILCHHNPDGSTNIEESRTDAKGRAATASGQFTAPRGYGFAYQWLFFSSANQTQFRFRYLGQQEKGGHKTYVLAFAQDPAKVINPAYFQSEGKVAPFYYQGILWVDQASFDVAMLRTDLLAPLKELNLKQLTTELKFRTVAIHGFKAVFWLPEEVYISSDQGAGPADESHRYSDYHLFHAESRILPEQ
jgi:hypothetical protein